MVISFEESIAAFLEIGRRLYASGEVTGVAVLDAVSEWFVASRIAEAGDDMDDMLLLQWGATEPFDLSQPADWRGVSDDVVLSVSGGRSYQYLDFMRQVFPHGGDPDVEFDDAAVQMSISLFYEPARGDEELSDLWVESPSQLETQVAEFRANTFVGSLISRPASRMTVIVQHCG